MIHCGIILCGMGVWTFPSFSQTPASGPRVLARVGDRFIDEKEFVERFELTPGLNRRPGRGLKEEKEVAEVLIEFPRPYPLQDPSLT